MLREYVLYIRKNTFQVFTKSIIGVIAKNILQMFAEKSCQSQSSCRTAFTTMFFAHTQKMFFASSQTMLFANTWKMLFANARCILTKNNP